MGRIELACMATGGVLMVACAAFLLWPLGLGVAGVLLFAAGWPKGGDA